jgi:hypothetical protein
VGSGERRFDRLAVAGLGLTHGHPRVGLTSMSGALRMKACPSRSAQAARRRS